MLPDFSKDIAALIQTVGKNEVFSHDTVWVTCSLMTENGTEDTTIPITEAFMDSFSVEEQLLSVYARLGFPEESAPETVPSEEFQFFSEDLQAREAYEHLYEEVFEAKGCSLQYERNAKGYLYVSLGSQERVFNGENVTARETLVYDRESENGKCDLIAY